MFPLQNRILIRGAAAHVRAGLGIGADYRANYVNLYASHDGKVTTAWGDEGGNWSKLTRPNGDRLEFAHLSKFLKTGQVRAGDLIAITGNTGAITDYPHLHIQIFDKYGRRLDPEKYDWGNLSLIKEDTMHRTFKGTIYALSAGFWLAIGGSGEEYKREWNVSEYPPEMTEAQFKAFPVHRKTIK